MTSTTTAAMPVLSEWPSAGETRAVALVLPGGRADSFAATSARQLTGVRMRPFARSLHSRAGRSGLAVWLVRYQVRGWNGGRMSPVADVRWALDEVRRRHGDLPVALVGHSMGGRTAMRVADDESVRGVVGLAPWLPDSEPVDHLRGRRLLVAHGSADRVTSPRAARRFVERAAAVGADAHFVAVHGEMHAMIFRPRTWHALATAYALDVLGVRPLPEKVQRVIIAGSV